MARYLLSVYTPTDGTPPAREELETIMKNVEGFHQELRDAGAWVFAGGLDGPEHRDRPAAAGGEVLMTDGPFAEAKEHLGGITHRRRRRPRRGAGVGRARRPGDDAARSRSGRSTGVTAPAVGRRRPTIARVFREEYGRAVAVLVRVFGDIDLAEEAVQDAFAVGRAALAGERAAAEPGRLDHHHRAQPGDRPAAPGVRRATTGTPQAALLHDGRDEPGEEGPVRDDRLRLIFTCCHPALGPGRPGRADAAAARRADHRGDRPRVPGAGADHGPAPGPRQGQDPRRAASRTGCRATPTCPTGCARCSRSST